ncbi:MAG: HD domain-containing protein [Sediminibacterium sp.]|nr:HD domain-containing protein [Sediminibacterium sp.]
MNFDLPVKLKPLILQLSEFSTSQGVKALLIGGFVRDIILKRPTKDIDIVLESDCLKFTEDFQKKYYPNNMVNYFKTYGVAQIKLDQVELQFVTARKESYSYESRNPEVTQGDFIDDQLRRDFTINCLALSLHADEYLKLIDPFNGINDLFYKTIKTPTNPEKTFSDDPLRMLRAIRFACQLDFNIEPETFAAIVKMSPRLSIISKERISDEIQKIMNSPQAARGWELLDQAQLLKFILPELLLLKGVENIDGIGHKDNFSHTLQVLHNVVQVSDDVWLRWASLLHDIGKPRSKKFETNLGWTFHGHEVVGSKMVKHIFNNLKLPLHGPFFKVQKLISLHHRPISLTKENITDSAVRRLIFDAGEDLEHLVLLCKADITTKNKEKLKRYQNNLDLVIKRIQLVEDADKLRNWQPPITGEDIMKAFDLKPCKTVGIIKDAIRESILDGKLANNYHEAWNFMLEKGTELGLKLCLEN